MYISTKIKCLEDYIKYDENKIGDYELLGNIHENNEENKKAIDL